MNRSHKSLILSLFALAFIGAMVSGCGAKEEPAPATPPSTSGNTETAEGGAKPQSVQHKGE